MPNQCIFTPCYHEACPEASKRGFWPILLHFGAKIANFQEGFLA